MNNIDCIWMEIKPNIFNQNNYTNQFLVVQLMNQTYLNNKWLMV